MKKVLVRFAENFLVGLAITLAAASLPLAFLYFDNTYLNPIRDKIKNLETEIKYLREETYQLDERICEANSEENFKKQTTINSLSERRNDLSEKEMKQLIDLKMEVGKGCGILYMKKHIKKDNKK